MHSDSNKRSPIDAKPLTHTKGSSIKHQASDSVSFAYLLNFALLALFSIIVAYLLSAALHAPPQWTLQVGGPGDTRFGSGFFLAERSEELPFRWSSPEARLVLHGADAAPLTIDLRANGDQVAKSNDPHLSLVAERPLSSEIVSTTFGVASGWRHYRVLLPPSAAGLEPPAYALISGTSRPGPQDGRDLGAAISTVQLAPLANGGSWLLGGWPLHPRALMLVWALAVLFGAVNIVLSTAFSRPTTDDRRPTIAKSTLRLSWAFIFLAAVGLIAWARTSPYTLAALFPPMPWTLVVLTGALLAGPVVAGLTAIQQRARIAPRALLWGGLGLLVVAQGLLNGQTLIPVGIILALLALALIVVAERMRPITNTEVVASSDEGLWARPDVLLGGIFMLALVLRFYQLGTLPYGLWRDEARHGLVALRILDDPDYRPIYVAEGGVNMPALIFYPFALELKLWGIHPWSMRPFTALAGALTVLPLYALTRRLFGARPALIAALLYAVSAWQLTVSRFSFPTVFDPLFGLTGLWLLVVAWEVSSRQLAVGSRQSAGNAARVVGLAAWFGSGVFMGLAIQTYHTGRVVPVIGGVLALGLLWQSAVGSWQLAVSSKQAAVGSQSRFTFHVSRFTPLLRPWLTGLLILAIGFLLVAGPMIWYALRQEAQFNDRVSGVFLLSEDALKGRAPLAALDETLGKHLLLFNVRGDENGRHAPPNRPGFDFVSGFGLLAGGALLLSRRPNGSWPGLGWRGLFLFVAIGLSMLPSALAVDAPHGMRSVGAIAFACIVASLGLEWLWGLIRDERRRTKDESKIVQRPSSFVPRPSSFVPIVVLALVLSLNFYTYFIWMKANPEVWVSFYPVHTQAGAYVRELRQVDPNRQIFVAAGVATNPVFVYLTYGYNVQTFDAGVASEPLRPGAIFILSGYTYAKDRETLAPYLGPNPQPLATGPDFPDGRSPSFVAYPAAPPAAAHQ